MSFFKRLFNIGQSEVNNVLDKLEDPIKMTEQGIRDLKGDLNGSLQGLAELKALAIRAKRDHQKASEHAKSYEQKAVLLLQRAQDGQMSASDADRLASEMLSKKEQAQLEAKRLAKEVQQHEASVSKMSQNINTLKSKVGTYENELRSLKARSKVSNATKKINKQLSQIDASGTISMLERMKDKVAEQEALAESYSEIAFENKSVDDEVELALGTSTSSSALLELKAKMGLAENAGPSSEGSQGGAEDLDADITDTPPPPPAS